MAEREGIKSAEVVPAIPSSEESTILASVATKYQVKARQEPARPHIVEWTHKDNLFKSGGACCGVLRVQLLAEFSSDFS